MNLARCIPVPMALLASLLFAASASSEVAIPRSKPNDASRYTLIESKRSGDVVTTLHKRVRDDKVTLIHSEINCKTRQMRELGSGEGTLARVKGQPTAWFTPVAGSSRSDLAQFVCKG